jgi:hypothetical protein
MRAPSLIEVEVRVIQDPASAVAAIARAAARPKAAILSLAIVLPRFDV